VLDLWTDYDDQYLMIGARPAEGVVARPPLAQEEAPEVLARDIAAFTERCQRRLAEWRNRLQEIRTNNWRAVIWGGGSKGVSFLTTLNIREEIEYVVDVNPNKHGTFMAGTGQAVVAPAFFAQYQPDVVIVMNPIYCREIQNDLDRLGVAARLWPV
jgi:hypothetical protein